jgi:FkbM family methyltransferase
VPMERPGDAGVRRSLPRGGEPGTPGVPPRGNLVRDLARIAGMGTGPLSKLKLFAVAFGMARSWWPARRLTRVKIDFEGRPLTFVVSSLSDLLVLRDTFLFEDFGAYSGDPHVIVDLGSNIGASVVYFRVRFPGSRIVAVEPDPNAFELLRRNTAAYDGIELRKVAVAAQAGPVTLYQHPESWVSSLHPGWKGAIPVTVQGQTLEQLLDELGLERVDLLKMDVEGAEFEILPAFERLSNVDALICEVHGYLGDRPAEALLECLDGFQLAGPPIRGRQTGQIVATRV